jgi:adenylate cyclase
MRETDIPEIAAWIAKAGLVGRTDVDVVDGFCARAVALGLPLARALLLIDTLHPVYEGRAFRWERGEAKASLVDYGSSTEGAGAERWRASPFYRLVSSGETLLRRRVNADSVVEFPGLADALAAGVTDYVAIVNPFTADGAIGEMDCFYSSWMTDRASGFSDGEIAALARLMPFLGLAVKSASLSRIARTLVETYLGRDAGQRVLSGRIARGVADRIETVLWFSDLRNYTRISDASPPELIMPLLNDYADAIVTAIHDNGGDVLKLIGDGVLAIFPAGESRQACATAVEAARLAQKSVRTLNGERSGRGLPATEMYLGLHIGEVYYGNIGSRERLDFTVIGPAVNEVNRIAAMCRSVDQPVLCSAAFVASAALEPSPFVSVGRYALRGVARPQELFTLDERL